MERYRDEYPRRKASLDAACHAFGISTKERGEHHGAFVDATLAYHLYHCLTLWRVSPISFEMIAPSNYVEPPPEPIIVKRKGRKRENGAPAVPPVKPSEISEGNFPTGTECGSLPE
jgi:DNA polymerase III epsilon subunit-like protein